MLVVAAADSVVPAALAFACRALHGDPAAAAAAAVDPATLLPRGAAAVGSGTAVAAGPAGVLGLVATPFRAAAARGRPGRGGPAGDNGPSDDAGRPRRLRVLTSADPGAVREALAGLSPATTAVVVLAVDPGAEGERRRVVASARYWLRAAAGPAEAGGGEAGDGPDAIARKQMFWVTGDYAPKGSHSENTFLLPRHSRCEAFSTCSAAGLLVRKWEGEDRERRSAQCRCGLTRCA